MLETDLLPNGAENQPVVLPIINAETIEEKEGERVICRECRQGSAYRSFMLSSEVDEANA